VVSPSGWAGLAKAVGGTAREMKPQQEVANSLNALSNYDGQPRAHQPHRQHQQSDHEVVEEAEEQEEGEAAFGEKDEVEEEEEEAAVEGEEEEEEEEGKEDEDEDEDDGHDRRSSHVAGVSWNNNARKWEARHGIPWHVGGKQMYLGMHATEVGWCKWSAPVHYVVDDVASAGTLRGE